MTDVSIVSCASYEEAEVEKADKSQGAALFRLAAQKLKALLKEDEIR